MKVAMENFLSFRPTRMPSVSDATVDMVDFPFVNPPCLTLINLCSSIKCDICVCIILSASLPGEGNNEIGLRFPTSVWSPPFFNGITFTTVHASGKMSVSKERLYMKVSWGISTRKASFKTVVEMLRIEEALFTCMSFTNL